MNYRGSYRHLLGNSKCAILAAIEIYNKPRIEYRDECFIILLMNAWELFLKATISKNRLAIFYPKRRGEPYKTFTLDDALRKAERFFPSTVPSLAVRRNLDLLSTYRDNAVHFYNQRGFGSLVYALAQTSIVNFKDLLRELFSQDLSDEINWSLLPLGISPPVDIIRYIAGRTNDGETTNVAVRQFLAEIYRAVAEVQERGIDTGRIMTVFDVNLQSTKKIDKADVLVGLSTEIPESGPLAIVKRVDPNVSHPLRQIDIVLTNGRNPKRGLIDALHGVPFTSYVFTAISWKYGLKEKSQYCWRSSDGGLTRYSRDIERFIRGLTEADVERALSDYRGYLRDRQRAPSGKIDSRV